MDRKTKKILFLISFGVLLYAAAMNLRAVLLFLKETAALIFPIIIGLVLAFVLSVPMNGFERLLRRVSARTGHRLNEGLVRGASLILTLSCIVLVIALAFTMAIPALASSVRSIYPLVREKLPAWGSYLAGYHIDTSRISQWLATLDFDSLSSSAGSLLDSTVNVVSSTISGLVSAVFGVIIAIYTLLSKDTLARQMKKFTYAHLERPLAGRLCHIAALVRDIYTKFLSGQCVEAIILGSLIFIVYSLFRLPYAGLIAFLTSLLAFVPYVGAFAACFIGAFLTLLAAPGQVALCVVVFLAVQFVENQFIYPHVVGTSVGLSPLWTLIAALLGGKLFGLPGIIFFIPFVAVLYNLIREETNLKLKAKGYAAAGQSASGEEASET